MSLFVDILFISSVALFLAGIFGVFVKAYNEKLKLRFFFISSLLCFSLSLSLGWDDAVKGFQDGYNAGIEICCEENSDSLTVETNGDQ